MGGVGSGQHLADLLVETSRGLLVACLRATGRQIYAINPVAVARYRDRYTASRTKSDHVDAMVLANILRTDMAVHRPLPNDSELGQAIAVLARAQQDAVWDRTQAHNKLRSLLREYYPTFILAFRDARGGITRPEARAVIATAPTPTQAATLTPDNLADAIRRAGRQRGVTAEADRLHQALATATLHQPPLVEQAMGRQALALLRALDTACLNAEDLATASASNVGPAGEISNQSAAATTASAFAASAVRRSMAGPMARTPNGATTPAAAQNHQRTADPACA